MLRQTIFCILFIITFCSLRAQGTSLKPGDIAIIGFQSDNNDQFAFLSLVNIAGGTQIQFSEKGWNGSLATPAFVATTEGVHTWTAPPTGLSKGSVVTISFNSLGTSPIATAGTVLSSAAAKLSTSGDELIAFQGPATSPNFIYAFGSRPWINSGTPTSNQSWLPAALVNGISARDFATENDDQYFKLLNFQGTRDSILAAIGNPLNWTRSNTRFPNFPDWQFQCIQAFYLLPIGDPTHLSSWGTNIDGTGVQPNSFIEKGQEFNFKNRTGIVDLTDNWTTGIINIDQNLAISLHHYQLNIEGISTTSKGKLIGSEDAQLVIRGKSASLKFDSSTAILNALNLNAKASISLTEPLQIVSGINKGNLLLGDSASFYTNHFLVLAASEKGESVLLPVGIGATITGKITVQKWIPAGKRNFRFMGHPFANSIALDQLTTDIDITGASGSVNGFTNTVSNNPSAFWFDAENADTVLQNGGWTAYTNTNGLGNNAWKKLQGMRINIRGKKGEGLNGLAYTPSAVELHLTDSINYGDQKTKLFKNNNNDGFNLIGNPFAAAIDMSKLLLDSNIVPNFYLWNPYLGNKGGYSCYPFSNAQILPSFSAFFAQTTNANIANQIVFPETCKVNTNNPLRVLGLNEKPKNQLEIIVETDSIEWDRQLIIFKENASDSLDRYDAKKILNADLSLFSWSKEKIKLCIDTRSSKSISTIPLGIISSLNQTVNLRINQFPDLPNYNLYLFDYKAKQKYLLKEGFSYAFETDSSNIHSETVRFEIQVSLKNTPSISSTFTEQALHCFLFPNPTNSQVLVKINTNKKLPLLLNISNAMGHLLYNEKLKAKPEIVQRIDMRNWSAGIYFITISNGLETICEKMIKY